MQGLSVFINWRSQSYCFPLLDEGKTTLMCTFTLHTYIYIYIHCIVSRLHEPLFLIAGIQLDNKKFCCLSAQANAITARNYDQTVSIAKCRTCILIGIHQHKVNSNTAHNIIVRLANYLSEQKL